MKPSKSKLTERQREVIQMLAEGQCLKTIAVVLGISVKTAEAHKYAIYRKLGIKGIADVTRYAIRAGIIVPLILLVFGCVAQKTQQTKLETFSNLSEPPIPKAKPQTHQAMVAVAPAAPRNVTVNLAWTRSTTPNVTGYRLYQGIASGTYTNTVTVGNTNAGSMSMPSGITNYVAATSLASNLEGGFSKEITVVPILVTNVAYMVAYIQTNSTLNTNTWANYTNFPLVTLSNPPPLLFYRVDLKINYGTPP